MKGQKKNMNDVNISLIDETSNIRERMKIPACQPTQFPFHVPAVTVAHQGASYNPDEAAHKVV